jgi:spore coat protein A
MSAQLTGKTGASRKRPHSKLRKVGEGRRFNPRFDILEDRSVPTAAIAGVTLDPALVPQFVNVLPQPLNPGFVYQPIGTTTVTLQDGTTATVPLYQVGAYQIPENLLGPKDVNGNPFPATVVYGYGTSAATATYPGRSFVVQSGSPIAVQWTDGLTSTTHLLPVDPTLLEPADNGTLYTVTPTKVKNTAVTGTTMAQLVTFPNGVPIVPHVHGGHTQAIFDGTPLEWFTPDNGPTGADFPNTYTFVYDNSQQAGTIWYHDHADGLTRVNVYAGLAGFYVIHDKNENQLIASHNLPAEQYDIPLAIQDRMFTAPGYVTANDPTGQGGQLYYPSDVLKGTSAAYPSEHPEFFGDTILVNGQAWPVLHVEPRMYRFRVLDGSEARFYNLFFSSGQDPTTGQPLAGLPFYQIGTDDGLLKAPVVPAENPLLGQQSGLLTIAPGERDDVVVDFSKFAGQTIYLLNNAPAPFPGGDPGNWNPSTVGRIMAFVVDVPKSNVPDVTKLQTSNPTPALDPAAATNTRDMALFETTDSYGRLIQELGTPQGGAVTFMNSADTVQLIRNPDGTQSVIEVWRVYNTTGDTHPIHLHQVSFQVLSQQAFTATDGNGVPYASITNPNKPGYAANTAGRFTYTLTGTPTRPYANEAGAWKDTVQMNPGEVTTLIAKFDLPGKYVWHCHILEHEEHDMMHWLVVKRASINLQGGMPGYEGAVNSAFDAEGNLRGAYLRRVRRVIEACDRASAVVILGCFYQRQDQLLRDEAAVRTGVVNVAQWVKGCGFPNVVLEIANEFGHGGFDHRLLKTAAGQAELIGLAKKAHADLLVSTSGLGGGTIPREVARAADFLLVHFNGMKIEDMPARIKVLKEFGKPVVCNEDAKVGEAGAKAAEVCVASGASWGLMAEEVNQHYPFAFRGAADDEAVYAALKDLTAP